MKKHKFSNKAPKALITTALLLLLIGIGKVVVVNSDNFDPIKTAFSQFHFSDIYFYWHRGHNTDAERDIVMVDVQYLHNREEIATLLDSIAAHHPRVVAIDIIFPPVVSLDPVADSHLTASVAACSKVVLATNAVPQPDGTWNIERSFFAEGHTEGVVNISSSVVRQAAVTFDSLPTFAAQVISQTDTTLNIHQKTSSLIDFGGSSIMTWTVGTEEFYLPTLEDKLVFVGDLGDLRDYHSIPIGASGQSRMSGTELHARATAALLSDTPYHNLPRIWSIMLQVILLYLFCLLLHVLPQTMDNWVSGALQVVFILLLLPVCYLLFLSAHLILAPTLALVGFGLAGLAKNITDAIIK